MLSQSRARSQTHFMPSQSREGHRHFMPLQSRASHRLLCHHSPEQGHRHILCHHSPEQGHTFMPPVQSKVTMSSQSRARSQIHAVTVQSKVTNSCCYTPEQSHRHILYHHSPDHCHIHTLYLPRLSVVTHTFAVLIIITYTLTSYQ